MKTLKLTFSIFILSLTAMTSVAFAGVKEAGGGDICEERIQTVRNDIKNWIQKGGAKALKLPKTLSVASYNRSMLEQIKKTSVRCVGKGDAGYPVEIQGTPKTCRFDKTTDSSQITCDGEKLRALEDTDQYILIHHEYAGLAGIETPVGATSSYMVSNQLTSFLEDRVVKRLVVKSVAAAPATKRNIDAYKLCPRLKSYTYGYDVPPYQIDECIEAVEGYEFQQGVAEICINLPAYTYGYYVSGSDVIDCLKKIQNRIFSEQRINYCKNLKTLMYQYDYNTSADDVTDCLK